MPKKTKAAHYFVYVESEGFQVCRTRLQQRKLVANLLRSYRTPDGHYGPAESLASIAIGLVTDTCEVRRDAHTGRASVALVPLRVPGR
jgi:hypothetical protein